MSKIYKPGELVSFYYKGCKSESFGKIVNPEYYHCDKNEVFIECECGWLKRNKRNIRKLPDEEAMIYILAAGNDDI